MGLQPPSSAKELNKKTLDSSRKPPLVESSRCMM